MWHGQQAPPNSRARLEFEPVCADAVLRSRSFVLPDVMIPDHPVGLRLKAGIKSNSLRCSAMPGNSVAPVPQADPHAPSLLTGPALESINPHYRTLWAARRMASG